MDALPDEVLLLILSRFDGAKELARLAFVSRRWWQLCKHSPKLRITIPSKHSTDSAESLLESVLSARLGLRELHIMRYYVGGKFCADLILKGLDQHSSTIEKLQLRLPQATIWTSLATEFPKLSHLNINIGRLQQSLDGVLFKNLHECHLTIRSGFSNASVEALLKACPALHTLSVFSRDDANSPLGLDSNSLRHLTMGWRQRIIQLRMPSLEELRLQDVPIGSVQNGLFCKNLHSCELCRVDGGAAIEALVKNCPMLHTLIVLECSSLPSPMSLESTSLKDLTIQRCEAVELKTRNLEKLFLQDVQRVIVDGGALKSVTLRNGCDVDAPGALRQLSTLELSGRWRCLHLEKVMSIANNICSLRVNALILAATEIMSKDDFMGRFPQLELVVFRSSPSYPGISLCCQLRTPTFLL